MFESVSQPRLLVLWCPDWPVHAHVRDARLPAEAPAALIEKNVVLACSAAARAEGVRRGMRQREAQARCPALHLIRYDPALDSRAFEPVLTVLEGALPGVHPLRPGMLAVRARGPARYYGGETAAALALLGRLAELGIPAARAGIADGLFAAERAARWVADAGPDQRGSDPVTIVPAGETAAFLAPLPVGLLEDPELVSLLPRLGIRTLGAFAALDEADVAARFGPLGARLHALAAGRDPRPATSRIPPRDVDAVADFEPPLARADQIAFGVRAAAQRFLDELLEQRLVCTALRVELLGADGESTDRVWLHPRSFTASEVVDRVRWQLDVRPGVGVGSRAVAGELRSPVARVRLTPETVDPVGAHERGIWGTGPDEGVHSGLSRVQGMLGHDGVGTAVPAGGRMPADRQQRVAWGDRAVLTRDPRRPWPGAVPPPYPATVYEIPRQVTVEDVRGAQVSVTERGVLSASPAVIVSSTGARRDLTAWAGPWPLEERWWDPATARAAQRFQVVDAQGEAWLLVLDSRGWWAHGRYD
ncbi:MAG TPA: DNA polymerase Y family protein [Pseudolysinimonas sp.]|nr:DNA polymerase Y family protein [Pseudolysinimonas sp.]